MSDCSSDVCSSDLKEPRHHFLQDVLGQANRAHTVMDSALPQSPLSNFKAAPLAEQHILDRNANILQLDFAMTMRRIVIAKHRKHSQNLNPRRVERQEDHALLSMARGIRIGLSHENADRASRIAYARRPDRKSTRLNSS